MIDTTERTRKAVRRDRWDDADWDETRTAMARLSTTIESAAAVHDAAPDGLADVFASVFKLYPELEEAERLDPERIINRAMAAEWMESADYESLHLMCRGDRIQSAMTTVAVAPTVTAIYERVADKVEEPARTLKDALDALDALTAAEERTGDEAEGDLGEQLAAAEQAVADATEALTDVVESQMASIGRDIRRAAAAARAEAEANDQMMSAWGKDAGSRTRMDADAYLTLADRLRSPRLRAITQLLGAMRSLSWGARRTKYNRLPEELHDITMGDDLAHVLPNELLNLAIPELEDEFFMRLLAAELMIYELQGVEREGRGSIIYVGDGSGSMYDEQGGIKGLWAKAVGLALLGIAKDEGRGFHACEFGGPKQVELFSFPEPAAFTTERMLGYAEFQFSNAGTCFMTGLDAAVELLEAEHAATGKATADIVFATDGKARVTDAWLAGFKSRQAKLGVKVYGLTIGTPATDPTVQAICDGNVADVRDLHSGDDVRHVFAGVS